MSELFEKQWKLAHLSKTQRENNIVKKVCADIHERYLSGLENDDYWITQDMWINDDTFNIMLGIEAVWTIKIFDSTYRIAYWDGSPDTINSFV